jgi:hypothetical protein
MAGAPPLATITDDAIGDCRALASALRRLLGPHPVPQSDPRTRGLLVEVSGDPDDHARLRDDLPPLGPLLALAPPSPGRLVVIAINETPSTSPESFLLRPHVDRRFLPRGFTGKPPHVTTVVFLDFPDEGRGGELVVFPRGAFSGAAAPRDDARRTVAEAGGLLVKPVPGRACRFDGDRPHAVIGYSASARVPWRLAAVIAQFTSVPDEPPPRRFLPGGGGARVEGNGPAAASGPHDRGHEPRG